jgi:hypothetical protein
MHFPAIFAGVISNFAGNQSPWWQTKPSDIFGYWDHLVMLNALGWPDEEGQDCGLREVKD